MSLCYIWRAWHTDLEFVIKVLHTGVLQGPSVSTPPLSSRRLSDCDVSGPLLATPASPSTRRHRQHAWGFPGAQQD